MGVFSVFASEKLNYDITEMWLVSFTEGPGTTLITKIAWSDSAWCAPANVLLIIW